MKKLIMLLAIPLLAVACGGGNGGASKPVKKESVVGIWEVTHLTDGELTLPASHLDNYDNEEKFVVYQITENDTFIIHYLKYEKTFDNHKTALKYKIEGNVIVTIDKDGLSIPDYKVTSLSDTSMTITPIDEDDGNMGLILRRVDEKRKKELEKAASQAPNEDVEEDDLESQE